MESYRLTKEKITAFSVYLRQEERGEATIQKYVRDLERFRLWLGGRTVTKDMVSGWKQELYASGRAAVTVNGCLAAIHSFLAFQGWSGCRVKYLKIQRKMFRDTSRELGKEEYTRLVQTARDRGQKRLALLLETICGTGVRVSEVKYITVEAARRGRADVSLKGKIRTILIPGKLSRKLLKYAGKQKITHGEIFLTSGGKGLSRGQIWAEMKRICARASVDKSKVFPHNLRHLFARCFYHVSRDIVRLADVLGHSSIETTRIYLITTGVEQYRLLETLNLVL